MPRGKKRLERAVRSALDKKTDKPIEFKGMMGAYVNGVQTLVVATRPDFVYVRIRGATGEVIQAFNDNVAEVWDLPVMVARDPKFKHIWRITGRDITNYPDWGGASYIPPHGSTHTFVGAEGYGSDPSWIAKRQFLPFLPMPNASGTNSIYIEQDYFYWDGRFRFWPGSGTADLLNFRPTGGGAGRFVTVYMRGDEGIPDYLVGPEFSLIYPPADPTDFILVPDPDVGIPICAISLQTGTVNIGWNEIYDLRLAPSAYSTTGSLVHIYDEGVSVGMVSALDFHGAGVEAVVSGSFAYILHTGTPGPPSGIVALDEGIVLGTGIYVDFVGDNIEATISGTHVRVFVTGAAGGVIAWDDGVPQCAGTIIDFGDNLDASCSGTVIRVDAEAGPDVGGTGTYTRAGQAIPLVTITGGYWKIPEGEYMTGTLSSAINGVWQTPVDDYYEQWPTSGSFAFVGNVPTGSVVSVIWGAPDRTGGAGDFTFDTGVAMLKDARFMVYTYANQAIGAGASTEVNFDTEVRDDGDYFDTTDHAWTPPTGTVYMYAQLRWSGYAAGDVVGVRIYKNGGLVARRFMHAAAVDVLGIEVNISFYDEASGSDKYEIQAYTTPNANQVDTAINSTYWFGWREQDIAVVTGITR